MSDWVSTTCLRCAVGCGLRQRGDADAAGLDAVRGDPDHPVSRGLACRRGIDETAASGGERVTQPLVRRGGDLVRTDWDTALATVASRFERALERRRDGVAVLGSGQQTTEAAYVLGKLTRGGFGTRLYDANTTLCMASAVTAYYRAFGSDAPPPTYEDIPAGRTHLIWGANPAVAHPVLFQWLAASAREADSRLVVVDPVESETAAAAGLHVRPEPGTDLALARGVLSHLVETGGLDRSFVDQATSGFDALSARLPSPAAAAETTGVGVETIERLADAVRSQTLLYWGMGVNQSVQGTATARALIDLCLATGNLGPGSGPFSLTGQANSMGARVASSKGTWPGHRRFTAPRHRETVAETWEAPTARLPSDAGPGPVGIVDAVADGSVDACWTVATNPIAGMPDATRVSAALEDTFLVVQDAFLTETAELADVVLPAATWGESAGTVMNMERTVSRVRPATTPPGAARQDVDIIAQVAARMGLDLFDDETLAPERVFSELADLTAGTPADLSGITYERLEAEGAVRWPAPDTETAGGYRYATDDGWSFPTESGRAQFSTGTHTGLAEPTDETYPLTLTTARRADAYNTGVRTRGDEPDPPTARIHPQTVRTHLTARDGDRAVVESRRGAVAVCVQPDDAVPRGMVWLPIHHPAVNTLTLPAVDPESAEPNVKQCAAALSSADARVEDSDSSS
jgi:assimilatory nitrate reductase catalytic subunit